MPRDPAINAALRDLVRRDFALPFADPVPLPEEFIEDTSDEDLNTFRAAGVAPTAREDANRRREKQRRDAQDLLIKPGVALAVTTGVPVVGTLFQAAVVGPVPLSPAVVEAISINFNVAAGADGGTHAVAWAAFISTNEDLTIAGLLQDQNLITASDAALDGILVAQNRLSGFSGQVELYPLETPIAIVPAFLKYVVNIVGSVIFGGAVFHIRQSAGVILGGSKFIPVLPRLNINVNTAPTRTRGTRAPVPRGAKIFVFQGGRILSERIVSWPALTSVMKARWFAQQLGQTADPNVEWIL